MTITKQKKPAGRPHNKNRQAALVLGDKTYEGKRCKRCSCTERYTKGSGCVHCLKANMTEARQLLKAARQHTTSLTPNKKVVLGEGVDNSVPQTSQAKQVQTSCAAVQPCDPEPLCPECGCGVEAEHEQIGGWLHRVSPWRCTICDWEDNKAAPPPVTSDLDFLNI